MDWFDKIADDEHDRLIMESFKKTEPGVKYRPGNSSEGESFMKHFCDRCVYDGGGRCEIALRALWFLVKESEYPNEWTYTDRGAPICTAFKPMEPK